MYWNTLAMPFDGTSRLRRGSPFGVALRDEHSDALLKGDTLTFTDDAAEWLYLLLDAPVGAPTLWVYRAVATGGQRKSDGP